MNYFRKQRRKEHFPTHSMKSGYQKLTKVISEKSLTTTTFNGETLTAFP